MTIDLNGSDQEGLTRVVFMSRGLVEMFLTQRI